MNTSENKEKKIKGDHQMETHYRRTNQAQALMRALVISIHPETLNVINQTLAVGCLVLRRAKGKENALIICTAKTH